MSAAMMTYAIPALVLLAGVVDDLRSRKVHNWLVLVLAIIAAVANLAFWGWPGLQQGLFACGMAMALCLPLVLARALGAGDMKLLMAFGLASTWNTVLWTVALSLVWGALLGVFRAILQGQGLSLLQNTIMVATRKKTDAENLHKIPYTIALFFGWLSYLTLLKTGGVA